MSTSSSSSSSSSELSRLAALHGCLDVEAFEKENIFSNECQRLASLTQTISTAADEYMLQLMAMYESYHTEHSENGKTNEAQVQAPITSDPEEYTGLDCYGELQEFIMRERAKMALKAELEALPKGHRVIKLKLQLCLAARAERSLRPVERFAELEALRQSVHIKSLIQAY